MTTDFHYSRLDTLYRRKRLADKFRLTFKIASLEDNDEYFTFISKQECQQRLGLINGKTKRQR